MNRHQSHQAEPFSSFMLEFSLRLGERATKEIYSSDFAMQFALAARGWHIEPWEETAQMEPRSSFSDLFFLSVLFFSSLCFTKVPKVPKALSKLKLRNFQRAMLTLP